MARKKGQSSKLAASAPEKVEKPDIAPKLKPEVKRVDEPEAVKVLGKKITSTEEAIALVKERFKNAPSNVSYVVMENCNIFYGKNKAVAIRYAKDFDLKYFEVQA